MTRWTSKLPAAMATFNKPSGVGLAGGALSITEANNLTVRKLDLTTLIVTKVPHPPGHASAHRRPAFVEGMPHQ